jgi:Ca-activated chloride channel family protein
VKNPTTPATADATSRFRFIFAFLLLVFAAAALRAEPRANSDQTLSPYFLVKAAPPATPGSDQSAAQPDPLPLKSTQVFATIAGVIADVTVTQTYANNGQIPLEAVYIFPGSTRAAVHALILQVGDRRIAAKIQKRTEARRTYEAAKSAGKTASLLEQQRPNVFQMNVANILPGDEVRVELHYTELLVPDGGVYTFVYPGVVGPRYSNRPASTTDPTERWVANPYLHAGDPDPAHFNLELTLAPGLPIQGANCRTHATRLVYKNEREARLTLDPQETNAGNRDFVFNYRLAGDAIQSGVLLSEGTGENFFLLQLQPPAHPRPAQIPPRDYVFVVDISGSMHGFPLDVARQLMRDLLGTLRPIDTFNVLLFSGSNRTLAPASLPATVENIQTAIDLLEHYEGSGSTELLPALKAAFALPQNENIARTISVITDGYVTVETEAFDLVRQNLNHASLFAFGIGSSVNTYLIEGLARAGQGEPFILTEAAQGNAVAGRFREMIAMPVLTRVKVEFEGFETYDVEPVSMPDVLAQRPVIVFGKWRGARAGRVTLHGLTGGEPYTQTLDLTQATMLPTNDALSHLWARARIAELGDYVNLQHDDARVAQITDLGLRYSLLTKYTSFVAVDEVVRRTTPGLKTVKQPLPLPAGVPEEAVGQNISTSPEPGSTALLLVTIVLLPLAYLRRRWRRATS